MKSLHIIVLFLILCCSLNANALLIKLDFSTNSSTDMWGNTTNSFDVNQASGLGESFNTMTSAILAAVKQDYYSTSYNFISVNQQLDIDFMIAGVDTDVSAIDANHYTMQIGSRVAGPHNTLGVACYFCVANGSAPINTIFGSVFSNTIFSALLPAAGGSWDLNEAVNAIAGTLSHEIAHGLGLLHPSGPASNPGESIYGIMATGASPTSMPNAERLKNRAFSDDNMELLIRNIGLRTVQIPEPAGFVLFTLALLLLPLKRIEKN